MSWIKHPVKLEGEKVFLVPMQKEHLPELIEAGKDPAIWDQLPVDGSRKGNMSTYISDAILKRINGDQYPFTIFDNETDAPIGSTRLFELYPEHKKLEIGWTWYDSAYWGKGHNTECKLLLLTYCFETLQVNRVQIKTRDSNLRSQAAIKKVGGKLEGVLRKDRIMKNGEVRDTVVFSIVSDEWKEVKSRLQALVSHKEY
jgi:RimJ/RimL family protein N-acetyltransferase